jgi:hypothetical protein
MRIGVSVTRALILLLVVRALAAPLALPDSARVHRPVVVRVCTWPAQRPQRLTWAETLVTRFRRGWDEASADPVRTTPARSRDPLGQARLTAFVRTHVSFVAVHVSDRARC